MNVETMILEGALRGCLSVLRRVERVVDWDKIVADIHDDCEMAIREASEALGESPPESCEGNSCAMR